MLRMLKSSQRNHEAVSGRVEGAGGADGRGASIEWVRMGSDATHRAVTGSHDRAIVAQLGCVRPRSMPASTSTWVQECSVAGGVGDQREPPGTRGEILGWGLSAGMIWSTCISRLSPRTPCGLLTAPTYRRGRGVRRVRDRRVRPRIVGWSVSTSMTTDFVMQLFELAMLT